MRMIVVWFSQATVDNNRGRKLVEIEQFQQGGTVASQCQSDDGNSDKTIVNRRFALTSPVRIGTPRVVGVMAILRQASDS